ncbi:MAG: MutS family DNA mismatch repair protein [Desulfitobacteriaceae bacterium]
MESREQYQKRKERYGRLLHKSTQAADRISNLRLAIFILGCGLGIALYRTVYLSVGVLVAMAVVFVYLVIRHSRVLSVKRYAATLQAINDNFLKRLDGEWTSFTDIGEEFMDESHPYISDLDIFGQGSLYQWINSAQTFLGRRRLRDILTETPQDLEEIRQRQVAVRELAGNLAWRQRFMAEGILNAHKRVAPDPLLNWAGEINSFYLLTAVKVIFRLVPAVTILLLILYWATSSVPFYWPLLGVVVQTFAIFSFSKDRSGALNAVFKHEGSIKVYDRMLRRLEEKGFQSDLLIQYQSLLRNKKNHPAYRQVERLAKIADSIAYRGNAIFLFMNILTLWDYQCMIALENWKKDSGRFLSRWLQAVGEVEALASLAVIAHDYPDWAIPQIGEGAPFLVADSLGHPLLTRERVSNDLTVRSPSGILLITGSNMSGKSTLLRTAGLNLVLAYAGAPVCATMFSCSLMRIYTCLRVSDDLEKSISSFYAELLRIKMIVGAAQNTNKPLFFLLDEIFKGTNSQDRHTGAKVLIRQLSKRGAAGLVSTHDLELGELERESGGKIKNYHFREYYQNNQIRFDYKLRPGIATTQNALYLIKLAGIEMDEGEAIW